MLSNVNQFSESSSRKINPSTPETYLCKFPQQKPYSKMCSISKKQFFVDHVDLSICLHFFHRPTLCLLTTRNDIRPKESMVYMVLLLLRNPRKGYSHLDGFLILHSFSNPKFRAELDLTYFLIQQIYSSIIFLVKNLYILLSYVIAFLTK